MTEQTSLLSPVGAGLFKDSPPAPLCKEYAARRFLQLDDVVLADPLAAVLDAALAETGDYRARVTKPHDMSVGLLSGGRRFNRIDPGPFDNGTFAEGVSADQAAEAVRQGFLRSGLTSYCRRLAQEIRPWVQRLTGQSLTYDREFLLTYDEGDFIAPHGDTQTSRRIMVQLPYVINSYCAMRAMRDGWMELQYDLLGSLRVHGPGIWHEVLAVQRIPGAAEPLRVLLTLRFPYDD
jgi:hypothetical protein